MTHMALPSLAQGLLRRGVQALPKSIHCKCLLLCCAEAEGSEEDSSDVSLVDEDDMEQDSEDL
jgi:hypothetical protein